MELKFCDFAHGIYTKLKFISLLDLKIMKSFHGTVAYELKSKSQHLLTFYTVSFTAPSRLAELNFAYTSIVPDMNRYWCPKLSYLVFRDMILTKQAGKKFRTCTIDSDIPDHSPKFALLYNCTHKLKLYLIALAQVTHIKSKLISNNSLEVGLMQKKKPSLVLHC